MGRFSVEYREGEKKIDVYVERGVADGKNPCVIIESTAFERWDGDPAYSVLPIEKQQQILANFIEAMEFQGIAVIIG